MSIESLLRRQQQQQIVISFNYVNVTVDELTIELGAFKRLKGGIQIATQMNYQSWARGICME